MAKWIRCPKCQCEIDIVDMAPGDILTCDGCGAQIRLPAKKTAAPAPKAAPPPPPPRGKQTALFRKMSGTRAPGSGSGPPPRARRPVPKKNNTPLILGGVVAGVFVLGMMLFLVVNKSNNQKLKKKQEQARIEERVERDRVIVTPPPRIPKEPPPQKPPPLEKTGGDRFAAPDSFEGGAEAQARKDMDKDFIEVEVDSALLAQFDKLASGRRVSDIVKEDYRWMVCIMARLLSEDETVARSSFSALRDICRKRNISGKEDRFVNPINMSLFNSKSYRAGIYNLWGVTWFPRNKQVVAGWDPSSPVQYAPILPEDANWEKILRKLRQGGGFDDPNEPGGQVIVQLRVMGKPGWVKLASFLDHDELSMCRSIVKALNYVTGQNKELPKPNTKDAVKQEWEYWLKNLPDK